MSGRKGFALTLALGLTLGLSSCATTPAIEQAAAGRLQQAVLAVSTSASTGDLAAATAALDQVVAELDAAKAKGEVTEDRYARILLAIDAVRAELAARSAPATPAPAPAEPAEEEPEEEAPPAEEPADPPAEEEPEEGEGEGDGDGGATDPTPQPSTPATTTPPSPTTTTQPGSTPRGAPAAG